MLRPLSLEALVRVPLGSGEHLILLRFRSLKNELLLLLILFQRLGKAGAKPIEFLLVILRVGARLRRVGAHVDIRTALGVAIRLRRRVEQLRARARIRRSLIHDGAQGISRAVNVVTLQLCRVGERDEGRRVDRLRSAFHSRREPLEFLRGIREP